VQPSSQRRSGQTGCGDLTEHEVGVGPEGSQAWQLAQPAVELLAGVAHHLATGCELAPVTAHPAKEGLRQAVQIPDGEMGANVSCKAAVGGEEVADAEAGDAEH